MILTILSRTPTWVWGLLAALLALGLSQTRQRRAPPATLLILPLVLLALGVSALWTQFAAVSAGAPAWLLALVAGTALRARRPAPAGAQWLPAEQRLLLPGSWLPMLLIVVIFSLRYAANVAMALAPDLRGEPGLQVPLAALYGLSTGVLLGRALSLLTLVRRPLAGQACGSARHA